MTAENQLFNERGQTMAEYGVVLGVITLLVIGAIAGLSANVDLVIIRVAGLIPS